MPKQDNIHNYEPLWGSWYVEEEIGEGSFGIVYKVKKEELGQAYVSAVKLISIPDSAQFKDAEYRLGDDASTLRKYFLPVVQNIIKEVNILNSLSGNSNILGYHDHQVVERKDRVGWDVLIRMEYVKPLKKYIKEHPMTRNEIIQLGIDICKALELCSKKGLIHRDIKDDNIFVNDDGVFKLGDFGIAKELSKVTSHGTRIGTTSYMAPEVYLGKKYDELVDIYSLGIVMYRLLNGMRLPFLPPYPAEITALDDQEAQDKRLSGEPLLKPINADDALAAVVLKACAFKPEDRYQSSMQFRKDLESLLIEKQPAEQKLDTAATEIPLHIKSEKPEGTINVLNQTDDIETKKEGTVNIFEIGYKPSEELKDKDKIDGTINILENQIVDGKDTADKDHEYKGEIPYDEPSRSQCEADKNEMLYDGSQGIEYTGKITGNKSGIWALCFLACAMIIIFILLLKNSNNVNNGYTGIDTVAGQGTADGEANTSVPAPTPANGFPPDTGKVLTIYTDSDFFQDLFNTYYSSKMPDDVSVNFVMIPPDTYQSKLDEALSLQSSANEPVDLFLVESGFAGKYVNSDYTLGVKNDVGLTDEDLSNQYLFTRDIVTDITGVQKGTAWQAYPGVFVYRRSIAKDVLGTDDPVSVQAALSDWDNFNAVAAQAAAKGYKMLSGYDDAFIVFRNCYSQPWIDMNNKIVIDPNIMKWVDQTVLFTRAGYNNSTNIWSEKWFSDMGLNSRVFGFFLSNWGISVINSNAGGANGDYAVCEGPQSFYWDGTLLCAAKGTDNINLVRDVMKTMTCDKEIMKRIAIEKNQFANNQIAMKEIAADPNFGDSFLGGQNPYFFYDKSASELRLNNPPPVDDLEISWQFEKAFYDYFNGTASKDEAMENFYSAVLGKYPNLSR